MTGLSPLIALLVLGAASVGLTIIVRQATVTQGFFAEQRATVAVLAAGIVVAAFAYVILCVRALRRARAWQAAGYGPRAAAALWALAITAVVVLLPVVVAVVLPRHPAP